MIAYQFKDEETGTEVDVLMESKDAVDIGAVIEHEGRKLRRLPPVISGTKVQGNRFINYQVQTGTEQATGADFYDEKGRPGFTSRRRAADWAAKKTGEGICDMVLDD